MGWLLGETWIWCLLAFIAGTIVAWLLAALIYPKESEAFAAFDIPPDEGEHAP